MRWKSKRRGHWWLSSSHLPGLFSGTVDIFDCFFFYLHELRDFADSNSAVSSSLGIQQRLRMLQQLDDVFLQEAGNTLDKPHFRDKMFIEFLSSGHHHATDYTLL